MVKVIKDNSKEYNITCDNCKSELQYRDYDILKEGYVEEYHGDLYCVNTKYIKCPLCNSKIILNREIY